MSLIELKLQPPQPEHINRLIELDKLCLGGLWSKEGYQRELASPNSCLLVLSIPSEAQPKNERASSASDSLPQVAIAEQIIGCGCFWAILEEAHITLLMIHPNYQGQGLGQFLLSGLLENAQKQKLERATLEVRVSNEVAISLYKKFGFRVAGRRRGYYQQTGEDALVLWRGDLQKPEFAQELEVWQQQISTRLSNNHWKLLSGC
jgi:[ribosomal protein S18]-alanine N-acetyltransferase